MTPDATATQTATANGGAPAALRDLLPGQAARVRGYREAAEDGAYREQLLRLGLIPGTRFVVQRRAALGRLIEIRFRGYSLALRPAEADCLLLEVL